MSEYFVISNSDGDTLVERLTGGELENRLNERWWGECPVFLSSIPNGDTDYWGDGILIIRGTIAPPVEVTTVTRYKAA